MIHALPPQLLRATAVEEGGYYAPAPRPAVHPSAPVVIQTAPQDPTDITVTVRSGDGSCITTSLYEAQQWGLPVDPTCTYHGPITPPLPGTPNSPFSVPYQP